MSNTTNEAFDGSEKQMQNELKLVKELIIQYKPKNALSIFNAIQKPEKFDLDYFLCKVRIFDDEFWIRELCFNVEWEFTEIWNKSDLTKYNTSFNGLRSIISKIMNQHIENMNIDALKLYQEVLSSFLFQNR